MFGPIVTKICERKNFDLKGLIHPAAQDGKIIVDAHFYIAKRHIMRFVNTRRLDVIVPEDVIEALTFDYGFSNTAIELLKLHRNYHGLKSCLIGKKLAQLGSVAEMVIGRKGNGDSFVKAYQYSEACRC